MRKKHQQRGETLHPGPLTVNIGSLSGIAKDITNLMDI